MAKQTNKKIESEEESYNLSSSSESLSDPLSVDSNILSSSIHLSSTGKIDRKKSKRRGF